jgi:hypothetical protein
MYMASLVWAILLESGGLIALLTLLSRFGGWVPPGPQERSPRSVDLKPLVFGDNIYKWETSGKLRGHKIQIPTITKVRDLSPQYLVTSELSTGLQAKS